MKDKMDVEVRKANLLFAGLLLFGFIFLTANLGSAQLVDWDENIYAEASRQMLLRGDFLNVYINNHLFSEKPPFFFWEQVISYQLFGVNEFAARFPSAVAGMLMLCLFYYLGRKVHSPKFGLIWGTVYLTSFLPSVFGRAAVIDHTFNLFIAFSAFMLYLFDTSFREAEANRSKKTISQTRSLEHWFYLTLASLGMGIACLTKGPLGGVIPLVGFAGYKIYYRKPGIRLIHFCYCAVLSLSIALSWYGINWYLTGESFLEGFIRFQLMLFSKPLEGHEGPFFYHFVIAFLGLLPWTPFLFAFRPSELASVNRHYRPLFRMSVTWIGFVLILFSFVSTKLPHYSASVYIPLTLLIAMNFLYALKPKTALPNWSLYSFLVLGLVLSALLVLMPRLLLEYGKVRMVDYQPGDQNAIYLLGIVSAVLFTFSAMLLLRKRIAYALAVSAIAIFLFVQGVWVFHLPDFIKIHQKPLLTLINDAHRRGGQIALYRMVSFAALFYGKKPVEVLYNYKFPGDVEKLRQPHEKDFYLITDLDYRKKLVREFPAAEFQDKAGRFIMFRLKQPDS